MKVAIITIAGIASRFNADTPEEPRHKIIYYKKKKTDTLLYHLLEKCMFADHIILVGGSRYEEVVRYCAELPAEMKEKVILIYNAQYAALGSGYSLYVGLNCMFDRFDAIEEVVFAEGDLDVDRESFDKIVSSKQNVLSYSYEPIYAKKAVVLYQDENGHYQYAFNSSHGLLRIESPFSVILNSGQIWKFTDAEKLKKANDAFFAEEKDGTNLRIIQRYLDSCESGSFELIGFSRWTNCNTRADYDKILSYWEAEDR